MTSLKYKTYRYCIVPCCTNTTATAKEKLFFSVPKDKNKRKLWTIAMRRDDTKTPELSHQTALYCCEDHFTIEEDMENYWQWKLTKNVQRIVLKPGIIPHKFECQKRNSSPPIENQEAVKRRKLILIQDAIKNYSNTPGIAESSELKSEVEIPKSTYEKCLETVLEKKFRSKAVDTNDKVSSVACPPIKSVNKYVGISASLAINSKICDISISKNEYNPKENESDNYSSNNNVKEMKYKEIMIKGTVLSIEKNPKLFLGLPKNSQFLIELLSERSKLPINHIYIVLKKIKLNESFEILAIQFGLSTSTVTRIFSNSLPAIAFLLQELIIWPSESDVKKHLPIPFRFRHYKVISIIDCFEMEIEKPSNPAHQAQTWSNYQKCNTVKYFISYTPDGLVNFVSHGYGGQVSDFDITKECGYLSNLTDGQQVMADKGFKNISSLLEEKGCQLVRLPSVAISVRSPKFEVKQSKQITALRTHVERVIGCIQQFKLLLPHACVDNNLIHHLDNILIISCGIMNMQNKLSIIS